MRVILAEATHASHSAQLARLLIAIDHPKLRQPNRQIAVTPRLRGINLDVMRAIHRLEQILLIALAFDRRVLTVFIIRKMARNFIQLDMPNVRRKDRCISSLGQLLLHQIAQFRANDSPFWHPQNQAGPDQR